MRVRNLTPRPLSMLERGIVRIPFLLRASIVVLLLGRGRLRPPAEGDYDEWRRKEALIEGEDHGCYSDCHMASDQ